MSAVQAMHSLEVCKAESAVAPVPASDSRSAVDSRHLVWNERVYSSSIYPRQIRR